MSWRAWENDAVFRPMPNRAEVLRAAAGARSLGRDGHRGDEFVLGHAVAVVGDRDPRVPPVPSELHVDVAGLRRDAVVHEVRDGGLDCVAQ